MKKEDSTDPSSVPRNPRFSEEIERLLRRDTKWREPPNKLLPFEIAHDVKWRQLLGKRIDLDLFKTVAKSVRLHEESEHWWEKYVEKQITYDEMVERCSPLNKDPIHLRLKTFMGLATKSKDAEFFRAMAEIMDFIREEGIPHHNEWGEEPSEEGQFLQVWSFLERACPLTDQFPPGVIRAGDEVIELHHRFPSLDQLWKFGCSRYQWDKGRWQSGNNSEKMRERLRKFLTRRGLPYRKAAR